MLTLNQAREEGLDLDVLRNVAKWNIQMSGQFSQNKDERGARRCKATADSLFKIVDTLKQDFEVEEDAAVD